MARVGLIVQARIGSSRLPGKTLMPLAGECLLGRILERLKRVRAVDELILAIPESDDALAAIGKKYEVVVTRGSEDDLLDRYYQAAKAYTLDTVVRIPADNVAPEPEEIDRIINFYQENTFEFCSNLSMVFNNGYPDGIGAEVFSFNKLEDAWKEEKSPEKREHVHLNFFNYQTQQPEPNITVGTIPCPPQFARPDIVLDVNTREQYLKMAKLYEDLYPINPNFSIQDIMQWWDKNR
jgi:spore coat polysaccharide biosynthesis protein SpsF